MPDTYTTQESFEPTLPDAPEGLELVSLATLYTSLARVFKSKPWVSFEPETISMHLGVRLDDLTFDKIEVLRTLLVSPDVQDNFSFILYATEVVNNNVADFDRLPAVTSLDLAYYIASLQDLAVASKGAFTFKATTALTEITKYTLTEEGYSVAVAPFTFLPEDSLATGQTAQDTADKSKALLDYVEHMRSL